MAAFLIGMTAGCNNVQWKINYPEIEFPINKHDSYFADLYMIGGTFVSLPGKAIGLDPQ